MLQLLLMWVESKGCRRASANLETLLRCSLVRFVTVLLQPKTVIHEKPPQNENSRPGVRWS